MGKWMAGLLAAAAVAGATEANAVGAPDTLLSLCLPHADNAAAQVSEARKAGFVTAPGSLVDFGKQFALDGVVLWRTRDNAIDMFINGIATDSGPLGSGVAADVCAVVSLPSAVDPVKELTGLLGIKPVEQDEFSIFTYRDGENGREVVTGNPEVLLATNDRRLRLVIAGSMAMEKTKGEIVFLLIPRKK